MPRRRRPSDKVKQASSRTPRVETALSGAPSRVPGSDQPWKIACTSEQFETLRESEGFHRLLDLARHVNQLRFAVAGIVPYHDHDTPNATRQRANLFFHSGGVLYEVFQLIPKLRAHFGDHPVWAESLGIYGSDADILTRLAQGGDLHRIRNHTAFHTPPMVAPGSLKRLALDEYIFTSGVGPASGGVYHDLADTIAVHWACGCPPAGPSFLKEMERVATEVREVSLDFTRRAERLLTQLLRDLGFTPYVKVNEAWEARTR